MSRTFKPPLEELAEFAPAEFGAELEGGVIAPWAEYIGG